MSSPAGAPVGGAACPFVVSPATGQDVGHVAEVVEALYAAIDANDDAGALSLFTHHAVFETLTGRGEGIRSVAQLLDEERHAWDGETLHALADVDAHFLRSDVVEVAADVVTHVRARGAGEPAWTVAQVLPVRHVLRLLGGRWLLTARVRRTAGVTCCPMPSAP